MTKHQLATYARYGIDPSKPQLDDADVQRIFTEMCSGHLNWENDELRNRLLQLPRNYPSGRQLKVFLRTIINQKYPVVSPKFWTQRGFDNATAEMRSAQYQSQRCRVLSVEYWKERGYESDDARQRVSQEQAQRSAKAYASRDKQYRQEKTPRSLAYWLARGYNISDATKELKKIASRHSKSLKGRPCWVPLERRNTHISFYIALGMSKEEARCALRDRQTTRHTDPSIRRKYQEYQCLCWWHTRQNLTLVRNIEKRSSKFHLDHRFSIYDGFHNNIDAAVIGSHINLQIIPAADNLRKQRHSDISKEELLHAYANLAN